MPVKHLNHRFMTGSIVCEYIKVLAESFNKTEIAHRPVFFMKPIESQTLKREALNRLVKMKEMQEDFWNYKDKNELPLTKHDILRLTMDFNSTLIGQGAASTLP